MNSTQPATDNKPAFSLKREIFEWVRAIVLALIVVLIIRTFFFTMIRVDGKSMMNTLQNGDRMIATILDMKIGDPGRSDIVICHYPEGGDFRIKRVIGLPGETLEIVDGTVLIDGEALDEPYVDNEKRQNYGPIELGEDEYFVMGDNRPNSTDSRDAKVGPLKRDAIAGKARFTIWPLSRFGAVE